MDVRTRIVLLAVFIATLALAPGAPASATGGGDPRPELLSASRSDATPPLRDIPALPPSAGGPLKGANHAKLLPNRAGSSASGGADPALQGSVTATVATSTLLSFEGVGNVNGVLPPDTVGDVGPNHYVQAVNLSFAVFSRSGVVLYGPADLNTLWQGFGGACELTNDGDPVVVYDHLADRWLISQFALPNFPQGPFYQCLAVSQTADPLGSWYRYGFEISNTKLNDYPKFGVWPDGYYMSINQFKCNVLFCTWQGQGVVAFDRAAMLGGGAATGVKFDLNGLDPNLGGMLPADLDGPPPLAGAPAPFCLMDDDAWGYSPDQIQCWKFAVDWLDPASSTFTFDGALGTAAFDSNLCAYARNCIPQPGGTPVDAISDRLMYRLQYRNFGTHETLVTNHTVDTNGADLAGIRWYELRREAGGAWAIHQQGTYAPDGTNRWTGSIAMNGAGEIGLGYSVSSATIYPSVRVTGRASGDAPGVMTSAEGVIVTGGGFQSHTSGRWGDYSSMSVDPVDDCTFWYTQEYYTAGSAANGWKTRIGAFTVTACDADGDAISNLLDPDDDNDSWTDVAEAYVGTSPLLRCTPNGWPPDPQPAPNGNGAVQIDDIVFVAGAFNSTTTPRAEIATQNGVVQIDDVVAFAGRFNDTCTP